MKARRSEAARKSDSSRWLARTEILDVFGWGVIPDISAVWVEALTKHDPGFNVTGFFDHLAY
ncbi:MAG: hypothetical protein IPN64_14520 [Propionivibrio sp.]|uniref:hypothetical protein n=1 Tax=Propionivibrio sp. TaxID=2212460 RepID=UPI0025D103CA|nr:hypothetical protein [Propionivibrio sp.]MBK7355792.1 hypothetical protein [Propionivibrio sp.]MBK8895192.1 hypothetical protein [Propionivibrio sp.]